MRSKFLSDENEEHYSTNSNIDVQPMNGPHVESMFLSRVLWSTATKRPLYYGVESDSLVQIWAVYS